MRNKKVSKLKKVIMAISMVLLICISLPLLFGSVKKSKKTSFNEPVAEMGETPVVGGAQFSYSFYIGESEYGTGFEMTWEDWVESDFNSVLQLTIDEDNYVVSDTGFLMRGDYYVLKNYYVVTNALYEIEPFPAPQLTFSRTFGENSPETISAVSEIIASEEMTASDVYDTFGWSLGDTIDITLSTNEVITMRIIGFNHDTLSSDHTSKAGITLYMTSALDTCYGMMLNDGNAQQYLGWETSYMRTVVMQQYYNYLPVEWQDYVCSVDKKSGNGSGSNYSGIVTTSDKLFILSDIECLGSDILNDENYSGMLVLGRSGEGTQYEYWIDNTDASYKQHLKLIQPDNQYYAVDLWLRSCSSNSVYECLLLSADGENCYSGFATNSMFISFAFCIGG